MSVLAADKGGLVHVAKRHHHGKWGGGVGQCDHARHVSEGSVEAKLAAERHAVGGTGWEFVRGQKDADRDGQVQSGTAFADALREPDSL